MKRQFSFFLFILGGICLAGCQMLEAPSPGSVNAKLVFIDVGQGDASLIQNTAGSYGLIDAGPDNSAALAWLKSKSISRLNWLVITHADLDHYGGAKQIMDEIEVGKVYLPLDSSPSTGWAQLLTVLSEKAVPTDTLYRGDKLMLMEGVFAKVLWPPENVALEGNRASTVLDIELSGARALFPGDIDSTIEAEIIPELSPERIQLLKLPHHGSASSNSFAFLAKTSPQWFVASCDSSVYGHPAPSVSQKIYGLLSDSSYFLRTDKKGTLLFEVSAGGMFSLQ